MNPMRFLIESVTSNNQLSGQLVSGTLKKGESIALAPTGQQSSILSLTEGGSQLKNAKAKCILDLELTYSVPIEVGNIIVPADERPEVSDQFEAKIHWLDNQQLFPRRT